MDDTNIPTVDPAVVAAASANPADKILDNLDAFVGVVIDVLTGGAFALSSAQARNLLQTGAALKASTAKVRELLDEADDEDLFPSGLFAGGGTMGLAEGEEPRSLFARREYVDPLKEGEESPFITRAEVTEFGRSLLAHHDVVALKSTLSLKPEDIEGLDKALKPSAKVKIGDVEGLDKALKTTPKVQIADVEGLPEALKALAPARPSIEPGPTADAVEG